jgi:hypothetical protein
MRPIAATPPLPKKVSLLQRRMNARTSPYHERRPRRPDRPRVHLKPVRKILRGATHLVELHRLVIDKGLTANIIQTCRSLGRENQALLLKARKVGEPIPEELNEPLQIPIKAPHSRPLDSDVSYA